MNKLRGPHGSRSRKQSPATEDAAKPPHATTRTVPNRVGPGAFRFASTRSQDRRRQRAVLWAVTVLCALSLAGAAQATSRPARPAHAARALAVNDEGHLHVVGESGADLIEEGPVTGTIPGSVQVHFNIGAIITATFVLYPRGGGTLAGHSSGALNSSGRYSSFGGTMAVTSGTGRYRHAHGTGGFYGVVNRKTDAATVQTRGTLHY
jgi:hypothetical protein